MRLVELPRKVGRGLFVHHAFDHAATMAFYFFLGTIPLFVLAGVIIGHLVEREGIERLAAPLYHVLPGLTRDLIRNELRDIAAARGTSIAPLSIIGFLWLTSNGFHNLMDVFELLIGARPRSWLRQRLIALVWVVATLTVICLAVWILLVTTGWAAAAKDAAHVPFLLQRLGNFIAAGWRALGVLIVLFSLTTIGLALFYRFAVIHPRAVRRRVWPGAIVAVALWTLVSLAFGVWVGTIGEYSVYYGGLATVAVTLLWFYLTSLSFLIGAEINAQLEGVREPRPSTAL
jgi:membrane protein